MSRLADQLLCLPSYLLPHHALSRLVYRAARVRRPWFSQALIKALIRVYRVDLGEAAEPDPRAYPDFAGFFTRALREGVRPLAGDAHTLVSPADGALSAHGAIDGDRLLQAKGRSYTVAELLGGDFGLAEAPFISRRAITTACTCRWTAPCAA
jgi:phosphatidylserine decarboxylase